MCSTPFITSLQDASGLCGIGSLVSEAARGGSLVGRLCPSEDGRAENVGVPSILMSHPAEIASQSQGSTRRTLEKSFWNPLGLGLCNAMPFPGNFHRKGYRVVRCFVCEDLGQVCGIVNRVVGHS